MLYSRVSIRQRWIAANQLLPWRHASAAARVLPVVTLLAGIAVAAGAFGSPAAYAGAALLGVVSAVAVLSLVRAGRLPCECFGVLQKLIAPPVVIRNCVLTAALAVVAAHGPAGPAAGDLPTGLQALLVASGCLAVAAPALRGGRERSRDTARPFTATPVPASTSAVSPVSPGAPRASLAASGPLLFLFPDSHAPGSGISAGAGVGIRSLLTLPRVGLPKDWRGGHLTDCECGYRVTLNPAMAAEADVVLFYIPTLSGFPFTKHPGQLWVGWSHESDVNFPQQRDATLMANFDLTMTYRRSSSIWLPPLDEHLPPMLAAPPLRHRRRVPAVYLASNLADRCDRQGYARALMERLPVDSYGTSLKNKTLPHDCGIRTKLHTIAQYKFTLAFENSITEDYVTEKFFEPLAAGSVPVYRGAPNVNEFAPADHCYINAADFSGPAELAAYLDHLHHDKDEYVGYLAWKRQPLRDSFLHLVADTVPHPLCRLARHITVVRAGTDISPGLRAGLVTPREVGTDGRAFSA